MPNKKNSNTDLSNPFFIENDVKTKTHRKYLNRHKIGAFFRSITVFLIIIYSYIAYRLDYINVVQYKGVIYSVLTILFFNFALLLLSPHLKTRKSNLYLTLSMNTIELVCYTSMMHFLGGIDALYLCSIYIVIMFLVGMFSPAVVTAYGGVMSILLFGALVFMEHYQLIQNHASLKLGAGLSQLPIQTKLTILGAFDLIFLVGIAISVRVGIILKRNRNKIRLQNQQLSKEILERKRVQDDLTSAYSTLQETQTQLVQSAKLASIGELAAGVAHELNQPLMVIRTLSQFTQRLVSQEKITHADLITQLNTITTNTKRMMNIINHLKTLSRKSPTSFSIVDINKIIEDCFLMVGQQIRLRNIVLKRDLKPSLPTVSGNANQLEQVFLNVISNALDAIGEKRDRDSKHLGFETLSPDVFEIITRPFVQGKNGVEILFKDTGEGIAKETLEFIFDPFFTTKDVGKGTGLGLSISYRIVRDHAGEITVADTGQNGTTIRIWLPTKQD
jgi:signal transduction histidine kinase